MISTLLLNVIPKDKPPFSLDGRAKINERVGVGHKVFPQCSSKGCLQLTNNTTKGWVLGIRSSHNAVVEVASI